MPLRCAELPRDDREDAPEAAVAGRIVNALHALMAGIVDYAGLFPPAGLDMAHAVHNYAQYRASDDAWMLGRFVAPVARLEEFLIERRGVADDARWRLSALLGADVANDVDRAAGFNARADTGATIDCLEARITAPDDVATLAALPVGAFSVFGELTPGAEPARILVELRRAGFNAKLRTGGVTADAFPDSAWLVHAMRACIDAGVPFKATAGLHHPMRGPYRLTYADSAPTGVMYGYVNLFLAAAFLRHGMSDEDATGLLTEQDATAIRFLPDSVRWRGHTIGADAIHEARERVATSFGSCSFREPVDELRELMSVA
jgi:hypothetical protein